MTKPRNRLARALLLGGVCAGAALPAAAIQAAGATPPANAYREYHVVLANGESGEPSIGWNPAAKAAFYGAGTSISKLSWDDTSAAAPMTAKDVTPTTGTVTTLDTIVTVDQTTSRTFFAELLAAGADISYSDDGGATWTQSTGVAPGALLDHESVGAGPIAATSVPHPLSNDGVYYCAQNSFNGACGFSYDGGLTYGPGVPAYNTPANDTADSNSTFAAEGGACSALHGHLKVGPDGTAYLPIKGCGGTPTTANLTNNEYAGGMPSMSVSTDNGQTWQVRMNPNGSNTDESDNSVAIGPKNTVYMTWEDGKNISDSESAHTTAAKVSMSTDKGVTWLNTTNLNPAGINNVMFPVVTVGDDNRAAVSFLGSAGIGDDQQNGFVGSWDLYVSTTYDSGKTWTTVDATAGDPVHRGCIDNQGIAPGSPKNNVCSNRNMLDFNDITTDSTGRVLTAYTKTCTSAACLAASSPNDGSTSSDVQDYVVRQTAGLGLIASHDGQIGATPGVSVPEVPLAYLLLPAGTLALLGGSRLRARRHPRARAA